MFALPPLPYLLLAALALFAVLAYLMRPRRFYFVRHGETQLNAAQIRQGEEGGLSPLGIEQAKQAGMYLARLPIRHLYSSSFERARETAQIINQHLKVPLTYSDMLVERRNPKEIIGQDANSLEVKKIVDQMDLAYHDDDYRYSDEENFIDLKRRARQALAQLTTTSAQENCVVTHGIFLKMLIAYMLYRERLTASEYVKLSYFNDADNANITVCEYHPWKFLTRTRGWEVVSYNETP